TKTSAISKSSPSSSSLEALQRGETPASGPLKEVHFEFDRYDLRTDARETLKANAAWLKSNPSARIEIEGHCDEPLTTRCSSPPRWADRWPRRRPSIPARGIRR